jgi:hypothetical protein
MNTTDNVIFESTNKVGSFPISNITIGIVNIISKGATEIIWSQTYLSNLKLFLPITKGIQERTIAFKNNF